MNARTFLALTLTAGAALSAQSLKPGLSLIPAAADNVEIYPKPVEVEAKGKALQSLFKDESSFLGLESKVGLSIKDLDAGVAFIADFPEPKSAPGTKTGPKQALTPFLAVLPSARGEALLAQLKAKKRQGVWSYALPPVAGGEVQTRFVAVRPGFLLIASDRTVLDAAQAAKETMAEEVDGPTEAWLLSHDTSDIWSAASTRSTLAEMVAGLNKPRSGQEAALALVGTRFKGLATKAQASITHLALGLDLPASGSVRIAARAFYGPGTPLAQEASALTPSGIHPLDKLPQDPFFLALGGQWLEVFNFIMADPDIALAAYKEHPLPGDLKVRYSAAMKAQADQIQSMSMLMAPPSKEGEPLMKGAVSILRVKDAAAYEAAQERVTALQAEVAKAAGTPVYAAMEKDVLPGTPSFMLTVDFEKTPDARNRAAQASMMFGFLFGGTEMRASYGQLDAHTWLSVFGSGEDLQWALLRAKQMAPLPQAALVKREDELLPSNSRFSLYLDLKGVRDAAQMVVAAMGRGQGQLPVVPRVPPLGLAFTCDPGGLEIRGGAQPETLTALRDLVAEVSKSMPPSGKQD